MIETLPPIHEYGVVNQLIVVLVLVFLAGSFVVGGWARNRKIRRRG